MPRFEQGGVEIQSHEDLPRIKKPHFPEREFARLLLDKTGLSISYEPTRFEYHLEEGDPLITVPDFRVVNPSTGIETYIEITVSINGKGRQRAAMQLAAPDTHYVVFCRDKLQAIQDKFPEYNLLDWPEVYGNGNGNGTGK